jgi:hypothetical protein
MVGIVEVWWGICRNSSTIRPFAPTNSREGQNEVGVSKEDRKVMSNRPVRPTDAFAAPEFTLALVANRRHPSIRSDEDIYAPLMGSWNVRTCDVLEDGTKVEGNGEWIFSRVLDGRGVQDVWILPTRTRRLSAEKHPRERYGTSIRTFDPNLRRWRVTWLNPVNGAFDVLEARMENGAIIQEGTNSSGRRIDWTFARVTPVEFHWIGKTQDDDGNWHISAEFFGSRSA